MNNDKPLATTVAQLIETPQFQNAITTPIPGLIQSLYDVDLFLIKSLSYCIRGICGPTYIAMNEEPAVVDAFIANLTDEPVSLMVLSTDYDLTKLRVEFVNDEDSCFMMREYPLDVVGAILEEFETLEDFYPRQPGKAERDLIRIHVKRCLRGISCGIVIDQNLRQSTDNLKYREAMKGHYGQEAVIFAMDFDDHLNMIFKHHPE